MPAAWDLMGDLFISHSSSDNKAAQELKARLEEKGHRSVFLDLDPEKGIQAGVSWERTLYTKLRSCRAVVALCSDNYLASQWCFAEIALARMEGKELFALQIEPWGKGAQLPSILTEDQYLDLRTDPERGYERLWNGFEVKGIVPEEHRAWKPGEPPYPGLRAFDESDAAIFFGRGAEVREGVELLNRVRRLGHPRMVMVLGSSGSGKSSLARAGIVPQLRRDKERWLVVGPFRPGERPERELALALSQAFAQAGKPLGWQAILDRLGAETSSAVPVASAEAEAHEISPREKLRQALVAMEDELTARDAKIARSVGRLKEYLERAEGETSSEGTEQASVEIQAVNGEDAGPGPSAEPLPARSPAAGISGQGTLAGLVTELRLARGASEVTVVLLIDQFEELLGHEEAGADHPANRFLRLLKDGIESEDNPPLALGTMRSDFLGMLQRSGPLRGVGFKSLSVGPMSEEGMRQVVEQPALLGQIDLEEELAHRLVRETGTPDALPLLAFTLRAMWDRYHATRRFDILGYEALGGLKGAIARVADDTLEAALAKSEEGTKRDLRIAFLSLARPAAEGSGWARQPARWDEMPERVRPMIQKFIGQRLLVKQADGTVEVAHEALFRSWKTLRGWLDANSEGLHLLREIRIDAEKWEKSTTDAEKEPYLWRKGRLARALELRERGVLKLTELDTSFIDASEREEKRKDAEEEARRKAELEQAQELAEEQRRSARRFKIGALAVGIVAILAGVAALIAYREQVRASDQSLIAIASEFLQKDPTKAALVLLELRKPGEAPRAASLMHEALAARLAVVELADGSSQYKSAVRGASFDPRGGTVVTASRDGTARLWKLDGSPVLDAARRPVVLSHDDDLWDAVFDPHGEWILTASNGGAAHLWRIDGSPVLNPDGQPVVLPHGGEIYTAVFSPDGEQIATASDVGTVRLWYPNGEPVVVEGEADSGSERPLVLKIKGGRQANSAIFDCLGTRLVVADNSGTVSMYRVGQEEPVWTKNLHGKKAIWSAVFDAGGGKILTASEDGTARLWQAADGSPVLGASGKPVVLPHDDDVHTAVFRPGAEPCVEPSEGRWILTASNDGTARLWATDGEPVSTPDGRPEVFRHDGGITSARFSPDGSRIVTASKDGSVRIWQAESEGEALVVGGPVKPDFANSARFGPTPKEGAPLDPASSSRIVTGSAAAVVNMFLAATGEPVGGEPDAIQEPTTNSIWDPGRLVWPLELEGHHSWRSVLETAFSPTGDWFVTASEDGTARVWRSDGKPVRTEEGLPVVLCHDDQFQCADFRPLPGRELVCLDDASRSTTRPSQVRCLNDPSREIALVPKAGLLCLPQLRGVAISPSGDRIVTTSDDKTARVWTASGEPVQTAGGGEQVVLCHDETVTSAAFDPTGSLIVTASQDKSARVWKADGSAWGESAPSPAANQLFLVLDHRVRGKVASAAFSPDGTRIVTAAGLGAWIWRADGAGEPVQLGGHEKEVRTALFDPRGNLVVTGSEDRTARVWDAAGAGDPQVLRGHEGKVTSAEFDHLSERVVTTTAAASAPGSARVWSVTYEGLGAEIRNATAVCLDWRFRRRTLGESEALARKRSSLCRACFETFRESQAADGQAFRDFRECSLAGRF